MTGLPVFYHGTRRGFTKGGYLTPRSFHGGTPTSAPVMKNRSVPADAKDFVYLTTDPNLAWAYAYAAVGRGKPKVLVVEPSGPIWRDPEHSEDMPAYRSNGWAKVVKVLTDPPFTEQQSRDGWVVSPHE